MGYRINHIHLKAPDPRKTAEWYGARIAFLQGPDDTRLELVEARKIAGGSVDCC